MKDYIKSLFKSIHKPKCLFDLFEVANTKIDPICKGCLKPLSEHKK